MNSFKISYSVTVLITVLAIAITLSESQRVEAKCGNKNGREVARTYPWNKDWNRVGATLTCDKSPEVCRLKGSSGRDCCRKTLVDRQGPYGREVATYPWNKDWNRIGARLETYSCVDSNSDRFNCGRCGVSCRYSEICCNGYCVNPMFDKRHCGGCSKKCNKGRCAYGMCNYA